MIVTIKLNDMQEKLERRAGPSDVFRQYVVVRNGSALKKVDGYGKCMWTAQRRTMLTAHLYILCYYCRCWVSRAAIACLMIDVVVRSRRPIRGMGRWTSTETDPFRSSAEHIVAMVPTCRF
jgi:hypothetical protein